MRLLHAIYLSVVLICLSLSNVVESQTLWNKNRNVYIKIIETEYNNDHPLNLEAEGLLPLMASLKIDGRDSEDLSVLFNKEQLQIITRLLPKAFASLSPNQEIVFVLDRKERGLAMLGSRESFVAGRIFYHNGALNIILGDIDKPRDYAYESVYDPTTQGLVSYDFNHGERKREQQNLKLSLTIDEDYTLVAEAQSPRWLSINVDAFNQQLMNIQQINNQRSVTKDFVTRDEMKAIIGTNTQSQKNHQDLPPTKAVAETQARPESAPTSLESRFKTLNSLKEQGLITEQEYQTKRQELLSEL